MNLDAEWLAADGQGGFASGTVGGVRTRRYHALLLTATTPPTGRMVLVNGIEAWADTPSGTIPLTTQRYAGGIEYPDGCRNIAAFSHAPAPCWTFTLPGGTLTQTLNAGRDGEGTELRWRYQGAGPCRLRVRPLLSGRDYHALHNENPSFDMSPLLRDGAVTWHPYPGVPAITASGNFAYRHQPDWYRRFLYTAEQDRGLDCTEDLASPGLLEWASADGAVLRLHAGPSAAPAFSQPALSPRDSYLARRGTGQTIIAGFPWFTDWGRDTFIALRGLCLDRPDRARAILRAWAGTVSEGMLPNRFPDSGSQPEYNAVDASLWFAIAATELDDPTLHDAVQSVLEGYASGTRFGIAMDTDGLIRAGEPGIALTWMDARHDGHCFTPRIGKPVEVQALWINALRAATWDARWAALADRAQAAFLHRFPDPVTGGLLDVVDADHVPGATDPRIRPNQLLAAGGLPVRLLDGALARGVVGLAERHLLTPLGLRTLAPADPGYIGRYTGGPAERDAAYHQGTAWPWLLGPFVDAWLSVRGGTAAAKAEARSRFLAPLHAHLETAGLGHVSEIADGDPPHTPRGCPFQAWSMGEMLRIEAMLAA